MPKGDKYIGLKNYLLQSATSTVELTFSQIEDLISSKLPSSSIEHGEAWWANDKSHSQAIAWLDAGYETDFVTDTYMKKRITFVKA